MGGRCLIIEPKIGPRVAEMETMNSYMDFSFIFSCCIVLCVLCAMKRCMANNKIHLMDFKLQCCIDNKFHSIVSICFVFCLFVFYCQREYNEYLNVIQVKSLTEIPLLLDTFIFYFEFDSVINRMKFFLGNLV